MKRTNLPKKQTIVSSLDSCFFYKGEAYYVRNQIKLMFECMTKAIPYLSETRQWGLLSRAYNIMAITSINRGNAPVAVDYYLNALTCAKENHLRLDECRIHINLGYLYMQNEIYQEATEHFMAAYDICQESPDKEKQLGRLMMIYTNLASCYLLQGDLNHAGDYVRRLNEQQTLFQRYGLCIHRLYGSSAL